MNYFEELNRFWRSGITSYLTPNANLLYLCLLDIANSRHWQQQFAVKAFVLEESTGIAKRNTLIDARNRLSQVGLIRFVSNKGSKITHYEILGVERALNNLANLTETIPNIEKVSVSIPEGSREVPVRFPEGETPESLPGAESKPHQKKRNVNKTNKIKDSPNPSVKNLFNHYTDKFKQRFGGDPVIDWGKDGAIFKELLKSKPEDQLKELLDRFFDSNDEWIKNSGYTIGVFKTQANKLIAARPKGGQPHAVKQNPAVPKPPTDFFGRPVRAPSPEV